MSETVSREEFERGIDRLTERMDKGFAAIVDQLKELNGRTRTVEDRSSVAESRLSLIERVVYGGLGLVLTGVVIAALSLVLRRGGP